MSRITLALGSLVVGILFGSLFLGNQTVTFVHPLVASPSPQFTDVTVQGAKTAVELGKEPTVPGFGPVFTKLHVIGGGQALDGLNCTDCNFEDATLEYSGGAVQLINPHFQGTIRVELKGPAANTAVLLPFLVALSKGQQPEPVNPNRPEVNTVTITKHITNVSWHTPYTQ